LKEGIVKNTITTFAYIYYNYIAHLVLNHTANRQQNNRVSACASSILYVIEII